MSTLGSKPDSKIDIVWWRVRECLRAEMDPRRFEYWVSPLRMVSADEVRVVIACRTPFVRDQVVEKLGRRIADLFAQNMPGIRAIDFVADPVQPRGVTRRTALLATSASAMPSESAPPAGETKDDGAPVKGSETSGGQGEERPTGERRVKIEDIKRRVAEYYSTTTRDLESPSRKRDVVRPRQVAMWLARQLSGRSYPEIARRFGGRDHTTVIHGCEKIRRQIEVDAVIATQIDTLRRSLLN